MEWFLIVSPRFLDTILKESCLLEEQLCLKSLITGIQWTWIWLTSDGYIKCPIFIAVNIFEEKGKQWIVLSIYSPCNSFTRSGNCVFSSECTVTYRSCKYNTLNAIKLLCKYRWKYYKICFNILLIFKWTSG